MVRWEVARGRGGCTPRLHSAHRLPMAPPTCARATLPCRSCTACHRIAVSHACWRIWCGTRWGRLATSAHLLFRAASCRVGSSPLPPFFHTARTRCDCGTSLCARQRLRIACVVLSEGGGGCARGVRLPVCGLAERGMGCFCLAEGNEHSQPRTRTRAQAQRFCRAPRTMRSCTRPCCWRAVTLSRSAHARGARCAIHGRRHHERYACACAPPLPWCRLLLSLIRRPPCGRWAPTSPS